jgi:Icc-related predicted phosphoesterase
MIIDCISDLHGELPELIGGGDILIVAGDLTASHTPKQFKEFFDWLIDQDYKHKVVIGGNHDEWLQRTVMYGEVSKHLGRQYDEEDNLIGYGYYYLCDTSVTLEGYKIYGTPWTRTFPGIAKNCMAFTVDGEEMLSKKWEFIPSDVDILVTHSPPFLIGDKVERYRAEPEHVGSKSLGKLIKDSNIKLHVFGHIHNGYGTEILTRHSDGHEFIFVNASIMNEDYDPVNKPIRITTL